MKKWKKLMIGLVCLLVIASAGTAYAGTTFGYYYVIITWLSSDYTDYQTKTTTGAAAYLHCDTVSVSDKTLICRMYDKDGNAGDRRTGINTGWDGYIDGSAEHTAGEDVRLRFAVNGGSIANVRSLGKWKSN